MSTVAPPLGSATAPRAISADPYETPDYCGVQPGGILVWTNRSNKYPTFEIQFLGPSPASPGDILTGTGAVVIHVNGQGTFHYQIRYIPANGPDNVIGTFSVRSCSGC
jgi:hypothetical protein